MWISRVYLRWYKSFNTRFHGYLDGTIRKRPWETVGGEFFPFVEIPIDRRITTVAGANESGKSHLLSAIEKAQKGHRTVFGQSGNRREVHAQQHICRYCPLDGLESDAWPQFGIELRADDKASFDEFMAAINRPSMTYESGPAASVKVFLDGGNQSAFAQIYDASDHPIATLNQTEWQAVAAKAVPNVRLLNSALELSNEVHVQQLIDAYKGDQPGPAYDPVRLQQLADQMFDLELVKGQAPDAVIPVWNELKASVQENKLGPKTTSQLEMMLFKTILNISQGSLETIRDLGSSNRGYVERMVAEINHRLVEELDVSQFWQQDEEFSLQVEYKGGFFYFVIRDKTGSTYTFNERSSGLRFFLSYYIQLVEAKKLAAGKPIMLLMDEPDGFLSATAQRNLLQVFEAICQPINNKQNCQLVYTTHSPFLLNRNFPSRVILLRKGDGSEGTQVVESGATRRYEPVRSGLGIDSGERLFIGTSNVVLEGLADQKVLTASIQRFGDPDRIDDMLDLNRVTFISSRGVDNVVPLLLRSLGGAERNPVVVVLVDGDAPGQVVAQNVEAKCNLNKNFIRTLDQLELRPSWNADPRVLEDIVPPEFLAVSACRYLSEQWGESVPIAEAVTSLTAKTKTITARIVDFIHLKAGAESKNVEEVQLRAGVVDAFVDLLAVPNGFDQISEHATLMAEFEKTCRTICSQLRDMVSKAEADARRDRLVKNVRLAIERYEKAHRTKASKADVNRCLGRIDVVCVGADEHARKARENVRLLAALLDEETRDAGAAVKADEWCGRFAKLWESPWKTPTNGWKSQSA